MSSYRFFILLAVFFLTVGIVDSQEVTTMTVQGRTVYVRRDMPAGLPGITGDYIASGGNRDSARSLLTIQADGRGSIFIDKHAFSDFELNLKAPKQFSWGLLCLQNGELDKNTQGHFGLVLKGDDGSEAVWNVMIHRGKALLNGGTWQPK